MKNQTQTERPRFRPAGGDLSDHPGKAALQVLLPLVVLYGSIALACLVLDWFLGSFIR